MLKRVPYRRDKALSLIPTVLDSTIGEVRDQLKSLMGNLDHDQAVVQQHLAKVDAIYEEYKNHPPAGVTQQLREPWPTVEMVEIVQLMTWRVCESSGPSFYITCDNPVHFFRSYGLKNPKVEMCFPLSSRHTLHCCWQGTTADVLFLDASQPFVKEMNRRMASTTRRFAFYHECALWLPKLLSEQSPHLSRILW